MEMEYYGGKNNKWVDFLKQNKGKHLYIKDLSKLYRQSNNVKNKVTTHCKGVKNVDDCRRLEDCGWIVPKKLSKKGNVINPHCRKVPPKGSFGANISRPRAPPPSPVSKRPSPIRAVNPCSKYNKKQCIDSEEGCFWDPNERQCVEDLPSVIEPVRSSYNSPNPIMKKNKCSSYPRQRDCLDNNCTWIAKDKKCINL